MITLTPAEEHLRDFLIERATQANPADLAANSMKLGELAAAVDPDGKFGWRQNGNRYPRVVTALWHVNSYEVDRGRPMVGAVAVDASRASSIKGFAAAASDLGRTVGEGEDAEHEFWRAELESVAGYWSSASGQEASGLSDAQFDAIMAELSTIKKLVRQVLHG